MKTILTVLLFASGQLLVAQKPALVVPTGHSSAPSCFSTTAKNDLYLTVSGDFLVKLWDREGKELRTYQSEERYYVFAQIASDGSFFTAITVDKKGQTRLTLVDVSSGRTLKEINAEGRELKMSADNLFAITFGREIPIKLYSLKTGKLIQGFKKKWFSRGSFSSDAKRLALLDTACIAHIWDVEKSKFIQKIPPQTNPNPSPFDIDFSPDGQLLAVCSSFEHMDLYDLSTGQSKQVLNGYTCSFISNSRNFALTNMDNSLDVYESDNLEYKRVANQSGMRYYAGGDGPPMFAMLRAEVTPDGKHVIKELYGSTELYELATGNFVFAFRGSTMPTNTGMFSPDGGKCLFTSGSLIHELHFSPGIPLKSFRGHTGLVFNAKYTPDGQKIASVSDDFDTRIWDVQSGKTIRIIQSDLQVWPTPNCYRLVDISPDGNTVFKTVPNPIGYRLDGAPTNDTIAGFDNFSIHNLAVSSDNQWLALADFANRSLDLINLQTRNEGISYTDDQLLFDVLKFVPKRNWLAVASMDTTVALFEAPSFELKQKIHGHEYPITAVDFSSDGEWMVSGDSYGALLVRKLAAPDQVRKLDGHTSDITTLSFSPDNRWIISTSTDQTARIWSVETSKEVAKIVFFGESDWAITTPEGLFDATPGAMRAMYFVVENEPLELDQLKERYYEPGLLSKIMGTSDEPLRSVAKFEDLPLYPSVESSIRLDTLRVRLSERNGGIGKVSLFINGKEVLEDVNPNRHQSLEIPLERFKRFFRFDTLNTVSIRAYNAAGWLKSRAYNLIYNAAGSKGNDTGSNDIPVLSNKPAALFALVVGTSNYAGEKLDLRFPDKDAEAMASALTASASQLFNDRVTVRTLTSNAGKPELLSSKENIKAVLTEFAGLAKPKDILILYFSGHGVSHGVAEQAQFYYLTKDIASEDLSDPEIRRNFAVSSNDLTSWLANIPAQKQVMILDACNSGKVVSDLASLVKKDLSPAQIVALDRMKDRTG
ncbi:MAG: caspase family protein, partial [Saprospiraceae bacterium]|nr:caspase family protein [Saprospiraceae bacterium]